MYQVSQWTLQNFLYVSGFHYNRWTSDRDKYLKVFYAVVTLGTLFMVMWLKWVLFTLLPEFPPGQVFIGATTLISWTFGSMSWYYFFYVDLFPSCKSVNHVSLEIIHFPTSVIWPELAEASYAFMIFCLSRLEEWSYCDHLCGTGKQDYLKNAFRPF